MVFDVSRLDGVFNPITEGAVKVETRNWDSSSSPLGKEDDLERPSTICKPDDPDLIRSNRVGIE